MWHDSVREALGDIVDIVTGRSGEVHNWAVWSVDTVCAKGRECGEKNKLDLVYKEGRQL